MRSWGLIAAIAAVSVAGAQQKAPPPQAQDNAVPTRTTTPASQKDASKLGGPLTAQQAVAIALSNQPTLESVRQAVIAADGRTKQLRARLLPQLGVGSTYYTSRFAGNEPNRLQTNVPKGYGSSASLTQLIFDGSHSSDLVQQAKSLRLVAEMDLNRAKEDLALQTLSGYFITQEASHLVAVNERNVANRDSQLQLAQSRFNSGLGGADDVLTAQTAKGDAVISLIQARSNADTAKISLLQTMGLDPQMPITLTDDTLEAVPVDAFDSFVSQSLSRRPEVLRAKASVDAAKFGARAAQTTSSPTLSSTVSFSTSDPGFPAGGAGYGLGLILSVPLFDGNLQAGVVQQANAALKSAQSDLLTAQLQVRTDVSQAYIASRGAEQQDSAAQTNLANAKESLRIAEGRYKAGIGLFLDIINAQAALLAAETSAATASAEVFIQRAALKRAGGLLTEK